MTTQKYNFSIINTGSNDIFTNTFHEVSNATNDLLGVSLIIVVFVLLVTLYLKRTQDIGKSFVSALHITLIFSVLLYYWGKVSGFVGVPDSILLLLVFADIVIISFLKYNRQDAF